ncbi:aminopeptidase N [Auritidibacter ignavus]|uniref:aminopeptidase N n=1 Tax=Auritidibacter ignavus TaxID=678932 RepID=UPI002FE5832D
MTTSQLLNITATEAQARATAFDVESYQVELDLSWDGEVFGSRTEVHFTAADRASIAPEYSFIDFVGDSLREVSLNGINLPTDEYHGARIALPVEHLADTNVLVVDAVARYTNTGEGLHRFVDPVDNETYLYSQFEVPDSRRVFTVFEQPDLKATFQFTVIAPDHWTVISNQPTPDPIPLELLAGAGVTGLRDDTAHHPRGHLARWEFTPTPRLSSYVTALIAGPYYSVHSTATSTTGREIPLGLYCRASIAEYLDGDNLFEITRQGFDFFEHEFNTPYPFEKYDQLFVPEFNAGAMENAGAVTFLEDYVFRGPVAEQLVERRAITILHEMAHMWFGDLVTMRWWNDLWLNESFAEFVSHVAAVQNTRFDQAWTTFSAVEKTWAYRQDQLSTTHPIVADIRDLNDVLVNFDGITYAKGASVLRQLVAYVGHDAFVEGVRRYFHTHAYGNTALKDLLGELQLASGRDLAEWSELWLRSSGINTLEPQLQLAEDGETISCLQILQSSQHSETPLRPHRAVVGCYRNDPAHPERLIRAERIELDITGETTEVHVPAGTKVPDILLVNDEDLTYAKVVLDPDSARTTIDRLSDVADSGARAVLWGALWHMTRDGVLSASAFISTLLKHLGAETHSSLIFTLIRQLNTALNRYVPASHQPQIRHTVAEKLWELATAAPAGSDTQLQFFKAFILHARHHQLEILSEVLSYGAHGQDPRLPGLVLSDELRWDALTSLVAGGYAGVTEIEAAAQADTTATGALSRHKAMAARPEAQAKADTWSRLVEADMSNTTQRQTIIGFNRVHDRAVLEPFIDQYFEVIDTVWGQRSHEMAETFAEGLFPGWDVSESTLEKASTVLASTNHSALQRVLAENRDDLIRSLRAQRAFETTPSGNHRSTGSTNETNDA